jgi:hypothetical protein
VLADAVAALHLLAVGVLALRHALHDLLPGHDRRVGARVELDRRGGDERQLHVRRVLPRPGLVLGDLQGEVHGRCERFSHSARERLSKS